MSDAEHRLLAIGPIDGRYAGNVSDLQPIMSEYGLIRRRIAIEAGWLATLGSGVLPDVPPLDEGSLNYLRSVTTEFATSDGVEVKDIENTTKHDVKAIEVWLKNKLEAHGGFSRYLELTHFGATSEDINNLAYAMQVKDAIDLVIKPGIDTITLNLEDKATKYSNIPMLARTHGQPATPTTLGKEMRIFAERLRRHQQRLGAIAVYGKFNGATGNLNSMYEAYPEVDWLQLTSDFVSNWGFEVNDMTTQIESHDWMVAKANELALGNSIMTDLSRDMWSYIMMGYYTQEMQAGEVGSSTMPHKVNPIDFENAEANFGVANAIFNHLSGKLPISRLQRDLSDSSSQRALGEAFGHTLVAQKSLNRGLGKVHADETKIAADLADEWSVLTEAVQTVMRRYGIQGSYEAIKAVTRGKSLSKDEYLQLVESIDLPPEAKDRLLKLTPATYIGRAPQLAAQRRQ